MHELKESVQQWHPVRGPPDTHRFAQIFTKPALRDSFVHFINERDIRMSLPPKALARQQIDAQLVTAEWIIKNYRGVDFSAGRGIVLREAPLKTGPCECILLVDRHAVGVIEAKKEDSALPA